MRTISLLYLALTATTLLGQEVSLQIVGCEGVLYVIKPAEATYRGTGLYDIEATRDGCAAQSAAELKAGKVAVLVRTEQDIALDDKSTFEIHLYQLPSWHLDAKQLIPGRQASNTYLLPSQDGSAILFIASENNLIHKRAKFAYRADAKLTPLKPASVKPLQFPTESDFTALQATHAAELKPFIPLVPVKELQTLDPRRISAIPGAAIFGIGTNIMGQRGIALIHSGKLTVFASQKLRWHLDHLAETGDAIVSRIIAPESPMDNREKSILTGRIAVYSAATGKETASLDVPPLKDPKAECLALWHDRLAVYLLLPKDFVVVDFSKHTFKLIPFDGQIDNTGDLHPVWVENSPKSVAKPGR